MKRLLSIILSFSLIVSVCAFTVSASNQTIDVWDGTVASEYAGGDGSENNPYIIKTPEQLARMIGYDVLTNYTGIVANGSANKWYKLGADIYLNDVSNSQWYTGDNLNVWYSGTQSRFYGNFDGDGYTVRGLYFDSEAECTGLFPVIAAWDRDVYFENITIADSYIASKNMAGAVAGRAYGGNGKTFYFENCYIAESVIMGKSAEYVGGFIGFSSINNNGDTTTKYNFENCASLAKFADGENLTYGLIGIHLDWYTELACSVNNTFAVCEKWHGVTHRNATIEKSYIIGGFEKIVGSLAETEMPLLDWTVWQSNSNGYPTLIKSSTSSDVWQGKAATEYNGGLGTYSNPYQIATAEQLAYLISKDENTVGKYYVLTNDIKLNEVENSEFKTTSNWYDSGNSKKFAGNLDGCNHIISGLYYSNTVTGNCYAALFPMTAEGVVISGIVLTDSKITMVSNIDGNYSTVVGGIVGFAAGKTKVKGCYVDETVNLENIAASTGKLCQIGGIVGGGNSDSVIDSCAFFGDINHCDGAQFGALVGDVYNPGTITISNSMCAKYTPSSGRAFSSTNNIFEISPASDICNSGYTVATLTGEDSFNAIKSVNSNERYFATEKYPKLTAVSSRFRDVNGDNEVNAKDIVLMKKHLLGVSKTGYADVNNDGVGDIRDLVSLKKLCVGFSEVNYSLSDSGVLQNLKIMGRYENDNGVSLNWTASTLEFNIYGGGDIAADIIYKSTKAQSGYEKIYFTVYVDGVRQSERLCLSGSSGGNAKRTVIAKNISTGEHNIKLVRQTEAYFGTVNVTGLSFAGYFTEKTEDNLLIEFIGDSITVGMGNLGKNGDHQNPITEQPDFQDGTQAYAYLTAKTLGVDYRIVSKTGIGVAYGYGYNFIDSYAKQNVFADNNAKYVSDRSADIVCINLGTNDMSVKTDITDAELAQKYIDFFNIVKEYNTSVKKVVFVVGGMRNSYLQAVKSAATTLGGEDAGIYVCETTYGLTAGEQGHPSAEQHKTLCSELTEFLVSKVITDENLSLQISDVFGDNMVIQRDREICVYGTGRGNGTVTLGNQTKKIVSTDGKWKVCFEPVSAQSEPIKFKVNFANREILFENVLVGDVYVTSGQSNMELQTKNTEHSADEYANGILRFKNRDADEWEEFTNQSVANLSAVSTLFAKELSESLENKIPIGIISTAVGASRIEDWTARDYCICGKYTGILHSDATYYDKGDHDLFDKYIAPISDMSVAGVLWYQGESNRGIGEAKDYYGKFENMVNCWREYFGNSELPFYTVQIMLYSGDNSYDLNGNAVDEYNIRIAQCEAARRISGVTLCTFLSYEDTVLPNGNLDIHPTDKAPVAKALANAALSNYYYVRGEYSQTPEYSGPLYDTVNVSGSTATVTFEHIAEGLMITAGTDVNEFEVMDSYGNWSSVTATLQENTVVINADKEIKGVRMGYHNRPNINLYNTVNGERGFCASPFVWMAE